MSFIHMFRHLHTFILRAREQDNLLNNSYLLKKIQSKNHYFLVKKVRFFGLDVETRNFEVLGRILASILGVLGRSWGRLGASWAPLRSSWAPLWRQSPYTKAATPPDEKNSKTMGPKILGSAAPGLRSGATGKHTIPKKS